MGHGDGDFLSFTHAWIDYINRGGLYRVKDEVYLFFVELEMCVYPLLHQQPTKGGHSKTKDEIIHQVKEDEDVLFAWTLLNSLTLSLAFQLHQYQANMLIMLNTRKLLEIAWTLPVTSAECERSVSRLRYLKTYLRSTTTEDRLNGLAMLYVH